MELIRQGKVREVYADGDDVILVASDRVSVYDVVLPTPIPDKGAILTQLSLWWFRQLADLVPNHVVSEDVPPEWKGRAIRCRRLEIVPVECIARGYLAGLGLERYRATGSISGVQLPPGLVEADRLPEPVFTPSTKAESGGHDEFMTDGRGRRAGRARRLRTICDRLTLGDLRPRRRDRPRTRGDHRRHQVRVRARRVWDADLGEMRF